MLLLLTQIYLGDFAVLGEEILEAGLAHVRRDVADVQRVGRRRGQCRGRGGRGRHGGEVGDGGGGEGGEWRAGGDEDAKVGERR